MSESVRITILGSAAGFPTRTRTNTAIALWRGRELHLFDAGEPVAAHLARRGVGPDRLRSVFVSHMHADHSAGLPMLIQWLQLNKRTRPLPLYLPGVSAEAFRQVLEMHYLFPDTLGFQLDLRSLRPGGEYEEDGLKVISLESRHLDAQAAFLARAGKETKGHSFSFLVTVDEKRIYLSGDIAHAGEVMVPAAGADLAIVELAHFTPEELGQALARVDVPRVVVTHLIHSLESVEHEIADRIRAAGYGGEVRVARDGEEVEL